ncbi:MAG TPA: hypothetical protein PLT66_06165, partial [Bacillota bacterium]|nr:hypothetical protein [Bacillota bacterium]
RILAAVIAGLMIFALGSVMASAYDPADDPIVTLSYLDQVYLNRVKQEILDDLGYASYDALKEALSNSAVDEEGIISKAKASVLSSFGYSSWSKAKTAFTTTTITEADRNAIANEAISKLMQSLNIASTDALREKLEHVEKITEQTKKSLANDLGYDSVDDLRQALQSGGSFVQLTLNRGDRLTAAGDCEIILINGMMIVSDGIAVNVTAGSPVGNGELFTAYSDNTVFTGSSMISVSGSCTVMIRGAYTLS